MNTRQDPDGRGAGTSGSAPVTPSGPGAAPQGDAGRTAPPASGPAAVVFGSRLPVAEHFVAVLADTGVSHGLIGPREVPILWERHVLNCAVVEPAFPHGVDVIDVGSGAGLPGVALAIARPDLTLHLVEPMLRRTTWLASTIEELALTNVIVHRARAEEVAGRLRAPFATARAVAPIGRLARWTFPLLAEGGTLVALKGSQAAHELATQERALRALGMVAARVETYGRDVLEVPTVTLELSIGVDARAGRTAARPSRRGSGPRPQGAISSASPLRRR